MEFPHARFFLVFTEQTVNAMSFNPSLMGMGLNVGQIQLHTNINIQYVTYNCQVYLLKNPCSANMVLDIHFGLICPEDIVPDVLCFVQMSFCKAHSCVHVSQRRFSAGNLSKQTILVFFMV